MDPRRRGLEVARGVLRTLFKRAKMPNFCHRTTSERDRDVLSCVFTHQRGHSFFNSQTPGRRPPHIIGRRVNTVSLGWVGAPNKRAPFRLHDAVIGFVDQCMTRSRIADQGVGV